jgi:hypothetical protein
MPLTEGTGTSSRKYGRKHPFTPSFYEESPQQSEVHNTTTSQEEVPIPLENFRIISESPEAYHIPEGYE